MKRAAAIVLVLAAACSHSTKSSVPTTTTQPSMTTRQVASIVAEHRPELQAAITKEDGCSTAIISAISDQAMKGVGTPQLPDIDALGNCEGAANSFATDGAALIAGLKGITPPAELEGLVAQTRANVGKVAAEGKTLAGCLPDIAVLVGPDLNARYAADDQIQNCDVYGLDADVKALKSTLGGWDAYI